MWQCLTPFIHACKHATNTNTEFPRDSCPALGAGATVQIGKAQSLPYDIYNLAQRTDMESLNVMSATRKHRVP